jgi:hypothetical protein
MTTNKRFNILLILTALITSSCNSGKYDLSYDKYYDNYTFDQLKDTLFSDTLMVGPDVDGRQTHRQWYTDRIQELINDLKDDWNNSDSLFPMKPFDKIKISKSPWEWSQTLTNKQANKLLKIVNNPVSFDWAETTNNTELIFEFYADGQVINTIELVSNHSVVKTWTSWPEFKKMKFGHLNSQAQHELNDLLKEIDLKN